MSQDKLRMGLIGFGLFGRHHAARIAGGPNTTLVAIAVRSEASRQAARERFPQATVLADYRELLARTDLDAVSIVVPNHLHFETCRAALLAHKHVLLEKPMALSDSQCELLVRVAAEQQRVLAIGHELRLSALWGGAKRLIDQGAIGVPRYALVELSRFPYRQGAEGWRYDRDRVGNWILEEPIHFFDLARWYLASQGNPVSLYARGNSRDASRPGLHDNFTAILNHAGGAYAVVSQTLAAFGHHQTAKITGTQGCIWAHWSAADARSDLASCGLRWGLGERITDEPLPAATGELHELTQEIRAFADAVQQGTPPVCTAEDGRWSTRLCLAALESIETGQEVRLVGGE